MTAAELLLSLFPAGHSVREEGSLLLGSGASPGGEVAVLGTAQGLEVGAEEALALAAFVLDVVRRHPGRPLLALLDSRGQRMSRRDEILGLNGYLAHLAAALELARRRGHRLLSLVYGEASSGSALALGFMADEVHAVEGARLWVMNLPAMARVTKIPLERLAEVSRTSPVLAPGLDNYVRLGAVESVWQPPLAAALSQALGREAGPDRRSERGEERGGRLLARSVAEGVRGGRGGGG